MTNLKNLTKKTSFRGDETKAAVENGGSPFGKLCSFRDEMASDNVKDGSITYGHQSELPRLPIPTLQETLDKFPKVMEALLLPEQQQQDDVQRLVHDFLHGEGPVLQKALVEYDKQGYESGEFGSYVEEFWNEAYLAPDSSVVLNLNPFFVLEGGVRMDHYDVNG